MRRAAVSLSILLALAAAPLSAQIAGRRSYEPPPSRELFLPDSRLPGPGYHREVANIRDNIRRARAGGLLTRREARRLDREARRIRARAWRYEQDGLSDSEQAELATRATALRQVVAAPPTAPAGR